MPLDAATFGLIPAPGTAPPAVVAVPGPGGALTDPTTGLPAPADMPDAKGNVGVLPTIDVGAPAPNAQPGQFGSEFRPAQIGETPHPGSAMPSASVPEKEGPGDKGGRLDAGQFGLVPAQDSAPPTETAPQSPGFLPSLVGSITATADALPRGLIGNATDYINAGIQTPFRMLTHDTEPTGQITYGVQSPVTAFQQGLADSQAKHAALAAKYPIASVGGELASAAPAAYFAAPYLAYNAASTGAPLLSRAGAAADYLGRNAAFGGMSSLMTGGDPTTGATTGAGLAALIPGAGRALSTIGAPIRALAPLWSPAAREASVARNLGRTLNGAQIETSPVGPLDLAQATNSPAVAAKVRFAQGLPGAAQDAAKAVQSAQAGAARGQIGQIGAPASAADAQAGGTQAIRDLSRMSRERERQLWESPALTDFLLPTGGIKQALQASMQALQRDEPGLLLGMTGDIRKAVSGLSRTPERANLQNINSFIGTLKAVARRPPPENARAGALASRLIGPIEKALDGTVNSSGAPSAVRQAYQAARDFTRQRATLLGTQDMRAVLARNPSGAYVADPSEGLRRFFNFSNGSGEGPQNIQQLIEFADEIKAAALGRGGAAEKIGMARDQLRDSARSYVAAALTSASRLGEGQNFNPKLMQDFLRTNSAWMVRSGLFQRPQIEASERLMQYASMLRRTEGLNPQGNSATSQRIEVGKTFIDEIMSKWTRRIMEASLPFLGHEAHGGGVGLVVGSMAIPAVEKAFHGAETAMRDLMAAAVLDANQAKGLMMRATRGNEAFLSPQTRELITRLRLGVGSGLIPHFAGQSSFPPPTPQPAAMVQP